MKEFSMKAISCLLLLAGLLLMVGCCKDAHFTPERPATVRGWHEFDRHGIHGIGEFLLTKGESVENGSFGVELVKTIVRMKCSDAFAENDIIPRAVLRFYKVPGRQTILELEVISGSTELLANYNFPVPEYGVDSVHVREINTKDEWIWFELWH
jgi:hypothetical protein